MTDNVVLLRFMQLKVLNNISYNIPLLVVLAEFQTSRSEARQ
jgi:hypothetical protein